MSQSQHDLHFKSAAFPAGTLLDTYYDRDVTRLSDRGRASNMIGDRWSEICSDEITAWEGRTIRLPDGDEIAVKLVFRLDAIPQIARIASRKKLQNPDFIVVGEIDETLTMLAIDAKFSIDTAKPAQVTAETLQALLDVGEPITELLPELPLGAVAREGLFISPDMPLTHYVMSRTRGRLSVRVSPDQVVLIPVQPVAFLKPLQGARLIGTLASCDGFRQEIRSNMLLALYYFRLARACYGAYAEMTAPILGPPEAARGSAEELEARTATMARSAEAAWDIVMQWDAGAEQIRRQREEIFNAMPFPVANKDLRDRVMRESEERGRVAPSINSVRKRLGGWYREQFEARIGVVLPPVTDLPALIQQIYAVANEITPLVAPALDAIIDEVFAEQPAEDSGISQTA